MTFEEFAEYIKNHDELGANTGTSDVQIATANIKLKQANIPQIPADFCKLMKKYNGISNNGSVVLGYNTGSPMFPDIVDYNIKTINGQETKSIILGYDDMYYLVYDYDKNTYKIIDKDDFSEEDEADDVIEAVSYILKI